MARSARVRALRVVLALVVLALMCDGLACLGQSGAPVSASDVQAAYIYNFGKFISWPGRTDTAPFAICVVGDDGFGATLDSLIANETIQGRKIAERRMSSVAGAETCDIVYLGASEGKRVASDLDALKDRPVLTVSGLPDFVDRGGMIQFVLQNNRVRFAVNLASAERARLQLSSELLKVAAYVKLQPIGEAR